MLMLLTAWMLSAIAFCGLWVYLKDYYHKLYRQIEGN